MNEKTELDQNELRTRLIADLPSLMAQYEAQRGPVETTPLMSGRKLPSQIRLRVSCPERKAVMGAFIVAPSRSRGRPKGPSPRNVAIMRELAPLNLPLAELIKRSGLSRPTVVRLQAMLRAEVVEVRNTTLRFRREWRMRVYRGSRTAECGKASSVLRRMGAVMAKEA